MLPGFMMVFRFQYSLIKWNKKAQKIK